MSQASAPMEYTTLEDALEALTRSRQAEAAAKEAEAAAKEEAGKHQMALRATTERLQQLERGQRLEEAKKRRVELSVQKYGGKKPTGDTWVFVLTSVLSQIDDMSGEDGIPPPDWAARLYEKMAHVWFDGFEELVSNQLILRRQVMDAVTEDEEWVDFNTEDASVYDFVRHSEDMRKRKLAQMQAETVSGSSDRQTESRDRDRDSEKKSDESGQRDDIDAVPSPPRKKRKVAFSSSDENGNGRDMQRTSTATMAPPASGSEGARAAGHRMNATDIVRPPTDAELGRGGMERKEQPDVDLSQDAGRRDYMGNAAANSGRRRDFGRDPMSAFTQGAGYHFEKVLSPVHTYLSLLCLNCTSLSPAFPSSLPLVLPTFCIVRFSHFCFYVFYRVRARVFP